ncbi:hypothetical protein CEXT_644731 [Caerostris extrusa]|uniref:Uncharacterized protein n=1 Tax=Caerostris extrusa TaxID=172846 RepID=A0AAV4MH19_CAEEX|nr:hypothetical protein CEXT_644731 [Caerostris extrusa]
MPFPRCSAGEDIGEQFKGGLHHIRLHDTGSRACHLKELIYLLLQSCIDLKRLPNCDQTLRANIQSCFEGCIKSFDAGQSRHQAE